MKEIKNCLERTFSDYIEKIMLSNSFPWYSQKVLLNDYKDNNHYFVHNFLNEEGVQSEFFESLIMPILGKIDYDRLLRIKGNLYTKTEKIIKHNLHKDSEIPHKVAIYYVNSNDGKTIFASGQEVESEKNKLLFFDGINPHQSTTCTDPFFRVNININYR